MMMHLSEITDILLDFKALLLAVAAHLQSSVEGQLHTLATEQQRLDADFAAIRSDIGATGLDADIALLRRVEAAIGQPMLDRPLWLSTWIDQWPLLTDAEYRALTGSRGPFDA